MADQLQYMPKIDLQRRQVLALGLAALHSPVFAQSLRQGRILIVGGAEDRLRDKVILKRFYDICGGELAHILVLTAASADPAASWASCKASAPWSPSGKRACTSLAKAASST